MYCVPAALCMVVSLVSGESIGNIPYLLEESRPVSGEWCRGDGRLWSYCRSSIKLENGVGMFSGLLCSISFGY